MSGVTEERRAELVRMVRFIMDGMPGLSEEEGSRTVAEFENAVPHPAARDLIFFPDEHFDSEPTAEEIVERALSYRAIQL
ncbi:bacteriocin immunity protein [Promicromonospora panici]|uniref:bacteriocin immunity protein n=1 Tax=Promicromonospora panici TaxID=2219658 RepID=UPI00101D23C7|nr:bacteriocin immunity protein [Promicromonospora panici]